MSLTFVPLTLGVERDAGVGLAEFILCRLAAFESLMSLRRPFVRVLALDDFIAVVFVAVAGFGATELLTFGVGCSRIFYTPVGLMNMPWPGSQSKYLCPWTEPSFLPDWSSNSRPTQSPGANSVDPAKRTVAVRPSPSWTS